MNVRGKASGNAHQKAAPRRRRRGIAGCQASASGGEDQTNAEQFYYSKQMQSKTPMHVVLTDGEELDGVIEWYDRDCVKLNRVDAPNLLLYKHCIKYLYKSEPE